jgi:hypothetical protein
VLGLHGVILGRMRKSRFAIVALLVALAVPASQAQDPFLAVFGESEAYSVQSAGPSDPAERPFFTACLAAAAPGAEFKAQAALTSPPAWGRTVSPETRGEIRYRTSFAGGFDCNITLERLVPNHAYILTLNGNPALAGNDLFLSPVPGSPKERYYDFAIVTTDSRGSFHSSFGVRLKRGSYDARIYVKDTSDFKIVLYHDYFKFAVE